MIQNYKRLALQIEELNTKNLQGAQIQKISSSSRYIALQLRKPGKTFFLYIGRGKGHEGLWSGESPIPPYMRVKDKLLEYLRRYLRGRRVASIELDSDDRIIQIKLLENPMDKLMLFYKGRELYVANSNVQALGDSYFTSWDGAKKGELTYKIFDDVGRKLVDMVPASQEISFDDLMEQELQAIGKAETKVLSKKEKKKNRKIENIKSDIEKLQRWKDLIELMEKKDLSLYPKKTNLCGFKFEFKKTEHYSRCSQLHDKIKRLKLAETMMLGRLKELGSKSTEKKQPVNSLIPIPPVWNEKNKNTSNNVVNNIEYKLYPYEKFDIGVGKSAKGNDQLRNSWAKKDDWWIHAEKIPSAHIIVKLKDTQVNIIDILPYTREYYGDVDEIDIIYTRVKYLKSVKGSPGKVMYKKEKRMRLKK